MLNGFGEFSSGGYNLHQFSDALGLVISVTFAIRFRPLDSE